MKNIRHIIYLLTFTLVLTMLTSETKANPSEQDLEQQFRIEEKKFSSEYPSIFDQANLLTIHQKLEIQRKINQIKEKYDFDYTLLILNTYNSYDLGNYTDNFKYITEEVSGVVFAHDLGIREYYTSARGFGREIFSESYTLDRITEIVVPYLKKGEFYYAYLAHLNFTQELLELETSEYSYNSSYISSSDPYYESSREPLPWYYFINFHYVYTALGIGFFLSLLIAAIRLYSLIKAMNTTGIKEEAMNYLQDNSFNLRHRNDVFIRKTEKTIVIKDSKSSGSSRSGGGGGY